MSKTLFTWRNVVLVYLNIYTNSSHSRQTKKWRGSLSAVPAHHLDFWGYGLCLLTGLVLCIITFAPCWRWEPDDVCNSVRYGHSAGSATPAGEGWEEHSGVSTLQNRFPTCEYTVTGLEHLSPPLTHHVLGTLKTTWFDRCLSTSSYNTVIICWGSSPFMSSCQTWLDFAAELEITRFFISKQSLIC